jgi:ribosomal protein S27E
MRAIELVASSATNGGMTKMKCPKCNGTEVTALKAGFGVGKALAGAVATGGIGLAAGFFGSNKIMVHCLKCGHKWNPAKQAKTERTERGKIKLERLKALSAARKKAKK